jgi:peptidoglycan/xylan/chitin deacetylase (PgdA/CDA1 family)
MRSLITAVIAALTLASCTSVPRVSTPATPTGPFKLAITIDDLPVHGGIPNGMSATDINRQMVEAIKAAGIPTMGFINGQWVEKDPANLAALQVWQAAGIPLANHSWAHLNFNDVPLDAYKQEIVRNEPLLDKVDPAGGKRWFRFPFLAEGEDAAKRAQIRSFLADRGYKIAGVTMDFSDWQYNSTYTRCRNAGDQRAIRRMEDMYLQAARDHVHHSRRLSRAIYGRDIPQVQLMHVGALSARLMPRLIELYRSMGAQFISLPEAQADPAYAEDNNLRLPARSQFINARAQALGVRLNHPADNQTTLDAMCR